MLSHLRSALRPLVRLVAGPIAALRISPNAFSSFAIVLAATAAYFIYLQDFAMAFVFSSLAVSIDLFDGEVARLQKRNTLFGNYFETMVDKMVEITLFFGCALLFPAASFAAVGFSMLASYAKPRVALVIITDNRDWPAIGEHAERMVLLVAGILLSIFSVSIAGFKILEISLWFITLIAAIGTVQRIIYAKKLIEEAERIGTVLPYLKKRT